MADTARTAIADRSRSPLVTALSDTLGADTPHDWTVAGTDALSSASPPVVDALVYDPGLLDDPTVLSAGGRSTAFLIDGLHQLVEVARPHLRPVDQGGSALVTVVSRDLLGWPGRATESAASAALVAATRSLALEFGRDRLGMTANVVVGLPAGDDSDRDDSPGPAALVPGGVGPADLAHAISFFTDPANRYITGQVLYVCGGASLLSSLSV